MLYQTKTDSFVAKRLSRWRRLEKDLKGNLSQWTPAQVKSFGQDYRSLCDDLSQARSMKLSPEVLAYINSLTGQAYKILYQNPTHKKNLLSYFVGTYTPSALRKNWLLIVISFLLFSSTFAMGWVIDRHFPQYRSLIASQEDLSAYIDMHEQNTFGERTSTTSGTMSAFYLHNNGSIALLSFAAGILFGLGTIYFLAHNGLILGVIFSHLLNSQAAENLIHFVIAHAVFELVGLIIAGAGGLFLGKLLLWPGQEGRRTVLFRHRQEILALVMVAIFCIFFAALVEGILSPSSIGREARILIAGGSFILILIYFFWGIGKEAPSD